MILDTGILAIASADHSLKDWFTLIGMAIIALIINIYFYNLLRKLYRRPKRDTTMRTANTVGEAPEGDAPDRLYADAQALYDIGAYDLAIDEFDKYFTTYPDHIEAINLRGMALAREEDHELAAEQFKKALKLDYTRADIRFNHAKALYHLGQHEGALAECITSTAFDNVHAEVYFYKGLVLSALNRPDDAITAFSVATALDRKHTDAYLRGGILLNTVGRHESALKELDKALALDPTIEYAHLHKGIALRRLGKYGESLNNLDKAIELMEEFAPAYFHRARAYALMHEYAKAIADIARAIDLDDEYYDRAYDEQDFHTLHGNPAFSKLMDDDPEYRKHVTDEDDSHDSDSDTKESMHVNDPSSVAYGNYLIYYGANRLLWEGKFEEAIKGFDDYLALYPDFTDAMTGKGIAYKYLGKYEEALNNLDKAIELTAKPAYAYFLRACTYAWMNERDKVIADLTRAIELDDVYKTRVFEEYDFDHLLSDPEFSKLIGVDKHDK